MFLNGGRRNIYTQKKSAVSPMAVCIVLAFILLICAIAYSAVDGYKKRNLVKSYLSNARSDTEAQNYSAAIDEYNKAV